MYLYEYKDEFAPRTKAVIDEILLAHDLQMLPWKGGYITYSMLIKSSEYKFVLSEFPGNCSSLILSNIQGSSELKQTVEFAIDVCKTLHYGALFVSGTSSLMKETLMDGFGFTIVVDGLFNPHSSYHNYFLMLSLNNKEEEECQE